MRNETVWIRKDFRLFNGFRAIGERAVFLTSIEVETKRAASSTQLLAPFSFSCDSPREKGPFRLLISYFHRRAFRFWPGAQFFPALLTFRFICYVLALSQ